MWPGTLHVSAQSPGPAFNRRPFPPAPHLKILYAPTYFAILLPSMRNLEGGGPASAVPTTGGYSLSAIRPSDAAKRIDGLSRRIKLERHQPARRLAGCCAKEIAVQASLFRSAARPGQKVLTGQGSRRVRRAEALRLDGREKALGISERAFLHTHREPIWSTRTPHSGLPWPAWMASA